ncbi:MAG: sulfotransferase, partial [Woeseiaceae bacterium]
MEIDRPIFLVGFGRSGSTHIYRVFSFHPRLAWLSKMADDYPHRMWINSATLRAFGATPFAELIARKIPAREGWRYWDAYFPGFSEPFRDLTADDVTPHIHERMQQAVGRIKTPSRDRVLIKLTGWPRISFLQEIFPDARFIHILRDGRAAVNSLIQTAFWGG